MNTIFVVTHLPPSHPLPPAYSYIHVGSNQFEADYDDSSGENISNLNSHFCELTALYWIWKNYSSLPDSVVGLGHYRRLLVDDSIFSIFLKRPVSIDVAKIVLEKHDLILPRRVPIFSGIYKHYEESHEIEDLYLMAEVLESVHAVSAQLVIAHLKDQRWAYLFNMFMCKKKLLDRYCAWIFPVLFEIHKRLDYSTRTKYQARVVGFLAERLFNIWLWQNPSLHIKEFPVSRLDKSGFSNLNAYRKDIYGTKPL
jgi:hypothetical protein